MLYLTLLLLSPTFLAAQSKDTSQVPTIDFCDLPNYKGKKVRITCIYTGFQEYWSIMPFKEGKCEKEYSVDLFIDVYKTDIQGKFSQQFNKIQDFGSLLITMTGVFETGKKEGYGHLGSHNAQFTADKLEKVEPFMKKARKKAKTT
jgi:hypothetical protein